MDHQETLFSEMKGKFPEIPSDTIRAHVKLYPRDRNGLISGLSRISATLGAIGGQESNSTFYCDLPSSSEAVKPHLGGLSIPEPPPALIVTPPQSPEKEKKPTVPTLSLAENLGFEAFLLQNQKERLHALEEQARQDSLALNELRKEVQQKEKLLFNSTLNPSEKHPNITVDKLLDLCQTNRQLCFKTHCLITEIDSHTDGRAPLGFYDNIYPGPDNPSVAQQPVSRRERPVELELQTWACAHCTFGNHPDLKNCEMCLNARSSPPPVFSKYSSDSGASSSSDSLSLPDSSESEEKDPIEIEVTKEPRGRSPICLRIRQRVPKDSVTFRFYKNRE